MLTQVKKTDYRLGVFVLLQRIESVCGLFNFISFYAPHNASAFVQYITRKTLYADLASLVVTMLLQLENQTSSDLGEASGSSGDAASSCRGSF